METKLVSGTGPGSKIGTEAIIDALRGAQRASISPLDYADLAGNLLGHYRVTVVTGASVSIGAGGILSYLRWTDATRFLVLMRVSAAVGVTGTITTAVPADLGLYISRGATANGSGGNAVTLSGNNAKLRSSMGSTLVSDMRVGTTGALTRPTGGTADANPIGATAFPLIYASTATGTAVASTAGGASPSSDLYKWDALGQHPVVLSPGAGETLETQEITAGPTNGSLKWYITYEWAEVVAF